MRILSIYTQDVAISAHVSLKEALRVIKTVPLMFGRSAVPARTTLFAFLVIYALRSAVRPSCRRRAACCGLHECRGMGWDRTFAARWTKVWMGPSTSRTAPMMLDFAKFTICAQPTLRISAEQCIAYSAGRKPLVRCRRLPPQRSAS